MTVTIFLYEPGDMTKLYGASLEALCPLNSGT